MNTIELSTDINKIVTVLTEKFNIEAIYLNTYSRKNIPNELVILLSNKYLKTLGGLVPRIANSIREFQDYKVSCYIAFQAHDKIREGSLYLFNSCQPKKLIYKKEGSKFSAIPEKFDFEKFTAKVYAIRDNELQKVNEFKDGYFFYKDKKEYSMASFMVRL